MDRPTDAKNTASTGTAPSRSANRRLRVLLLLLAVVAAGGLVATWRLGPGWQALLGDGGAGDRDAGEPLTAPPPDQSTADELLAEGRQLAEDVAAAFPENAKVLTLSGRIFYTCGSAAKAVPKWEAAQRISQGRSQGRSQGQGQGADAADAWFGLAEYAHTQGDFRKAIDTMRQLEGISPVLARQKVVLTADSMRSLGDFRGVVTLLEDVEKTQSLPPGAYAMLGQAYLQLKDYPRAVERYQAELAQNPRSSVAHYGLSMALARLGRSDEAKTHRARYAELQKDDMVAFDRRYGHGTTGDRDSPESMRPILATFHFAAARAYAEAGQIEGAQKAATRAWALAPNSPDPPDLLRALRAQSGGR